MNPTTETRAMLLTPPGAGAIAVVRVIGPDASAIVDALVEPMGHREISRDVGVRDVALRDAIAVSTAVAGDRLRVGRFVSGEEMIDEVVVSRADQGRPAALDIACHGGVRVVERILEALIQRGASLCTDPALFPPVWPGRNRIEDEAASAMTSARTERAVRFLAWQRRHLPAAMRLAADLCGERPDEAQAMLTGALSRFKRARTLLDGAMVAIVGPSNTGKSTLFNGLVGRAVTIVSPQAGTTRDWVDASVAIEGVPIRLVDTAGWRLGASEVESAAIAGGAAISEQADAWLLVVDGSRPPVELSSEWRGIRRRDRQFGLVLNKADVGCALHGVSMSRMDLPEDTECIEVSALHGTGLDQVARIITRLVGWSDGPDAEAALFTPRQTRLVVEVLSDLPTRREAAGLRIRRELLGDRPDKAS